MGNKPPMPKWAERIIVGIAVLIAIAIVAFGEIVLLDLIEQEWKR
jgi:hypothetical protein